MPSLPSEIEQYHLLQHFSIQLDRPASNLPQGGSHAYSCPLWILSILYTKV